MPYSDQYRPFTRDKDDFFNKTDIITDIPAMVRKKDYRFLAQNKPLIEQEFNQLFPVLQKKGKYDVAFWNYCYYCCLMLEAYYQAYEDTLKAAQYQKQAARIKLAIENGQIKNEVDQPCSFIASLGKQIMAEFSELVNTPQHLSKVRSKIGLLNMYRMYWAFLRTTLTSSFLLVRDVGWIDRLGKLLNKKIDVDKIIKTLEKPSEAFRVLSVGFFVARFILNAAMVMKHTFFPSEAEANLTRWERFKAEVTRRHPDFVNDIVWATVNGVSNYAPVLHIAAPIAGWLTGGFLFFDVCLLLWRRHLAEKDYLTKKAQYLADQAYYKFLLKTERSDLVIEQLETVSKQLKELELTWKVKSATLLFNATAALLLASGFAASMLFGPAGMIVAAYVVCVLAVAMYLSDAEYSNYKESKLRLQEAKLTEIDVASAMKAYQTARYEFAYTLAKNAIIPGLIIAAYAICWQAALVLTVAFLAYELWKAYSRHQAKQEAIKLAAPEEPELLEDQLDGSEDDDSNPLLSGEGESRKLASA